MRKKQRHFQTLRQKSKSFCEEPTIAILFQGQTKTPTESTLYYTSAQWTIASLYHSKTTVKNFFHKNENVYGFRKLEGLSLY